MATNQRTIWMWQSNPNPYSDTEPQEWTKYSKMHCEVLEKAYQQQQKEIELDNYIIDFVENTQTNKYDSKKQRPIKRILNDTNVNAEEKPAWMWKSNSNPYVNKESEQWTNYSEVECEVLEDAYQQQQKTVELDNYIIDLEKNVQINKHEKTKERPIRRILIDPSVRHLREERFSIPQKPVKSDSDQQHFSELIAEWLLKNKKDKDNHPEWVEQAANGIYQEGLSLGRYVEAKYLHKKLKEIKYLPVHEIVRHCIHLYTKETFLYKIINKALREKDRSKVDTLGAFCYYLSIMNYTQGFGPSFYKNTVYRGMTLTKEEINDYKASIGTYKAWLAFNSTSKIREEAEVFGNTLFVINCIGISRYGSGIDISNLSRYPYEQEVLLQTGTNFRIDKVDKIGHKYCIHITVV